MPDDKSNETAAAEKAAKELEAPADGGRAPEPANGEKGSDAHAQEGAQADFLTAEGVASLLKSDLTEAVEEPAPDEIQTAPEKGDSADKAKVLPEAGKEKVKNPEAAKEVEAWKETVAELEKKLEAAEGAEAEQLEKELAAARADMGEWEKLARGESIPDAAKGPEVPEALAEAIAKWEETGKGELPPALQGLVEDRIHKVTSQRDAERAAREAAEAKAAELESRLATRPPDALTALPTLEELDAQAAKAEALVTDLENVVDGTANEQEIARVAKVIGTDDVESPEAVRAAKRTLREVERYRATLPAQRQQVQAFRTNEAKLEPTAREWFPFLYDKSHPDYREAEGVLQVMPELRQRTPAHRFALGTYILGLRELRRLHPEAFGKTPPKVLPRKAPVKSPVSGSSAAAPNGAKTRARTVEEANARAEHEKRPTKESARKLLRIGLRA